MEYHIKSKFEKGQVVFTPGHQIGIIEEAIDIKVRDNGGFLLRYKIKINRDYSYFDEGDIMTVEEFNNKFGLLEKEPEQIDENQHMINCLKTNTCPNCDNEIYISECTTDSSGMTTIEYHCDECMFTYTATSTPNKVVLK